MEEHQNISFISQGTPASENIYRPKYVFEECKRFVDVTMFSFGPSTLVCKVFKW
jgi:hypothetical protein